MADYDVAIIGGGPAGYSAALRAAELGASVALIEAEKPGGSCVHFACIPTNILLNSAAAFVEAQEFAALGVFSAGDRFNFARAAARKDALVKKIADGIGAALRMRKVKLIAGRAQFTSPTSVSVTGQSPMTVTADAIVIATGTRWEPPSIPGVVTDRILTADAVQSLASVPASALILGGGPAETAFALEYALLLALAGANITVASPRASLLPGLDPAVGAAVRQSLVDVGITVLEGATVERGSEATVDVRHSAGTTSVDAEVIIAADVRVPFVTGIGLEAAGVVADGRIAIDRSSRTSAPNIFAAGDVTGGLMLTNAAQHMGEVAGENAAGGSATTRLANLPHLLHTIPECGWVGATEQQARESGANVIAGSFDLAYNARAVTLGAREGIVKLIADRDLGQILGVHVAGPSAAEILNLASFAMQSEMRLEDLAAFVAWHPSMAEGLVEAAKRALAAR